MIAGICCTLKNTQNLQQMICTPALSSHITIADNLKTVTTVKKNNEMNWLLLYHFVSVFSTIFGQKIACSWFFYILPAENYERAPKIAVPIRIILLPARGCRQGISSSPLTKTGAETEVGSIGRKRSNNARVCEKYMYCSSSSVTNGAMVISPQTRICGIFCTCSNKEKRFCGKTPPLFSSPPILTSIRQPSVCRVSPPAAQSPVPNAKNPVTESYPLCRWYISPCWFAMIQWNGRKHPPGAIGHICPTTPAPDFPRSVWYDSDQWHNWCVGHQPNLVTAINRVSSDAPACCMAFLTCCMFCAIYV